MACIEGLTREVLTWYLNALAGRRVCVVASEGGSAEFEALSSVPGRQVVQKTAKEIDGLFSACLSEEFDSVIIALNADEEAMLAQEKLLALAQKDRPRFILAVKNCDIRRRAGEESFLVELAALPGVRSLSYGLLDGNPWMQALWGQEYEHLIAECDFFFSDPLVRDLWFAVERYLVASLPPGFSAHLLFLFDRSSREPVSGRFPAPWAVERCSEPGIEPPVDVQTWALGILKGWSRSRPLSLECWMHSQSKAVLDLMLFLDRNLFERTLGRPFFQREFEAVFLDQWAVDLVRGWHQTGRGRELRYKGVPLGEPAEYDNLQLVLAAVRQRGKV